MSVKENKAIVRRWHEEVFSKWNLDAVDEILHPAYVRHPNSEGVAATKEWLARMAGEYPEGQIVTEDTIAEGDKVVTRWKSVSGGKTIATGVSIHRIADGKIAEDWAWSQMLSET
jgi:predicted SnoaL-like aldol condensation-catalyzing enzyme